MAPQGPRGLRMQMRFWFLKREHGGAVGLVEFCEEMFYECLEQEDD
jgi:hypothetical protein